MYRALEAVERQGIRSDSQSEVRLPASGAGGERELKAPRHNHFHPIVYAVRDHYRFSSYGHAMFLGSGVWEEY